MSLQTTSSQTIGPYLHIGLTWLVNDNLAGAGIAGEQFTLEGRVVDGDGTPVNDAVIETWQANAAGRYAHSDDIQDKPLTPGFMGFGRMMTDGDGRFRLTSIKPGRAPSPGGGLQAPHLSVTLFTRGLLKQLVTRLYFGGDPANAEDAVLQSVAENRRATLVAQPMASRAGHYQWTIVLQGEGETVFFEI